MSRIGSTQQKIIEIENVFILKKCLHVSWGVLLLIATSCIDSQNTSNELKDEKNTEIESITSNKPHPIMTDTASYAELKNQITTRFKVLEKEEMITAEESKYLTGILISDIEFFENNSDTVALKNQVLISLKKMKTAELDTEDREAIAHWYFVLTQKKEINVEGDLNRWLYAL
jgi:hypothetical protein